MSGAPEDAMEAGDETDVVPVGDGTGDKIVSEAFQKAAHKLLDTATPAERQWLDTFLDQEEGEPEADEAPEPTMSVDPSLES